MASGFLFLHILLGVGYGDNIRVSGQWYHVVIVLGFFVFCSRPILDISSSFFFLLTSVCICTKPSYTHLGLFLYKGYGGGKRVFMRRRQSVAPLYICISFIFWPLAIFSFFPFYFLGTVLSIFKWSTRREVHEVFRVPLISSFFPYPTISP